MELSVTSPGYLPGTYWSGKPHCETKENQSFPVLLLGHHKYMVQLKTPNTFVSRQRNIDNNRQLSLLASFCSTLRYCAGCSQRNDVNGHAQPWTMHLRRATRQPRCVCWCKKAPLFMGINSLQIRFQACIREELMSWGKNGLRTIGCRAEPIDVLIMI